MWWILVFYNLCEIFFRRVYTYIMPSLDSVLDYKLLDFHNLSLSTSDVLWIVAVLLSASLLNKLIKKLFKRVLKGDSFHVSAKAHSLSQISSYVVYFAFLLLALNKLGINITVLLAGSTALMLGVGVGLQQNVQNFMAGITVLLDGTVKVGEIVIHNGSPAKVVKVGFRTSVFETKEGVSMIIPNSKIVSEVVENVSYNNKPSLFLVEVGVDYSSSPVTVTKTLLNIAKKTDKVLPTPKPFVRFSDFGDSALKFQLFFSTTSFFEIENIKSILRYKIHSEFGKEGIKIPFPQRDIHIKKN